MKTKQKTLHPNQAKSSLTKRSIEKFMKNRMALIGAIILIIMVLACILAPLLTPHDPTRINPAIRSLDPCKEHILGTDRTGRDIFARILYAPLWMVSSATSANFPPPAISWRMMRLTAIATLP